MAYDFKEFKEKSSETEEWLKNELLTIQTGRATPAVLDGVLVDAYGSKAPLQQVASITVEDAKSLRLIPYNSDDILAIQQAIDAEDMGVSVSSDDKGVRVNFPELTTETREKYVKMVGKKLEAAKISLRQERDEVWSHIQKMEKESGIGKDVKFRLKEEMEKMAKDTNEKLEALAARKETEVKG